MQKHDFQFMSSLTWWLLKGNSSSQLNDKYMFVCSYQSSLKKKSLSFSLSLCLLVILVLSLLSMQVCWTVLPWCSLAAMPWTPLSWQLVSVGWFPTWWIPATPQASPVSDLSLLSRLSWYAVCFRIFEVCFCSGWEPLKEENLIGIFLHADWRNM